MQGYIGNNSHNIPQPGVDNLLARRMALERQRSMPGPYPYWPVRDPASLIPKTEIAADSKLLPTVSDNSPQPHLQNADLMSVLQGLSDRPSSGVNNNVVGWSNFNVQSGSDVLQTKMDLHHDQSFAPPQSPLGIQQQRLQLQNQPSFPNLFPQVVDNTQGIPTPDKLLPSSLSQDPQLLNMLQQQYLLQLHSQAPVPTQQISLLDKILLLKQQQQKQEEQQMLLRQQQQQQLLSQVLSEHQNRQHFGELSFGQLQVPAIPKGNPSIDPRLQPSQDLFPVGSNMAVPNMQHELSANLLNFSSQVNQDNLYNASSEASSLHLPHQMFDNVAHQKSWGATLSEQVDDVRQKDPLPTLVGNSPLLEVMNKSTEESLVQKSISLSDTLVTKPPEMPSESPYRQEGSIMVSSSESILDSAPLELPGILVSTPQPEVCAGEMPKLEDANDAKVQSASAVEEEKIAKEKNSELSSMTEVKNVEVREPKKASEKKSKKQKSSKAQSSEQAKGAKTSSVQQTKQSETEKTVFGDIKLDAEVSVVEAVYGTSPRGLRDNGVNKSGIAGLAVVESQPNQRMAASLYAHDTETSHVEDDSKIDGSVAVQNTQVHAGQRAWKPAPGFRAKSLLEIQQEEQTRAKTEMVVSEITTSNSLSLSTPWVGVVANSDPKISREAQRDVANTELNVGKPESSLNHNSKKSHLHDLLAEEVLAKSSERDIDVSASISSMPSPQVTTALSESMDDDNFIEAKDTKKSRKKSAKAKGAGSKVSVTSTSVDVLVSSSPAEKGKSSRAVQQEKEVLPAIPSGPSLGDFVLWKGEPANPSPSPAWSTDSGKIPKPTSLRDILKEQEKKVSSAQHVNQIPTPQKPQPTQATRSSGPSWSLSGSSPAKAASPIQINSVASQSRHKGDDDLFWGPIDQTKQETKQYDFFLYCTLYLSCLLASYSWNFFFPSPSSL